MNKRGEYTDQLPDLSGTYFRDANDELMMRLKESSHLFDKASITHRVAFCPRTSVPLVYKAQDSWFIDIQSIKDRLIAANEQINWYPEHFKHGRFLKSIESAPDRGISRTRYRGTPMPVYVPASALESGDIDPSQAKVIGSREELFNHQSAINPTLTKFTLIRHGESVKNIE
jgi:isoleucyl-tRNA synthetase